MATTLTSWRNGDDPAVHWSVNLYTDAAVSMQSWLCASAAWLTLLACFATRPPKPLTASREGCERQRTGAHQGAHYFPRHQLQ